MTRLLCFAFCLCAWMTQAAAAPSFPPLTGRVVDQAQILSPQTETQLDQALAAFEKSSGGGQVVVATVSSLQGYAIEDYGYQLGRAWGIGAKDKNTGVVLLVAPKERQVRIEVGYGYEGVLTDALSRIIIEHDILPSFRAGDMEAGVVNGTKRIIAILSGEVPADLPAQPQPAARDPGAFPPLGLILLFLLFMFLGRGRRRRGILPGVILGGPTIWRGGGDDDIFRGGGGSFGGGGASGRW
jgi:uncharacterized protein